MVSNTAIGVHGGGKRFDQNPCMGRGRVDPPGETRMPVSLGKRKDHVFHESQRLLEWVSFRWKFLLSNGLMYIVGH